MQWMEVFDELVRRIFLVWNRGVGLYKIEKKKILIEFLKLTQIISIL